MTNPNHFQMAWKRNHAERLASSLIYRISLVRLMAKRTLVVLACVTIALAMMSSLLQN